MHLLVLSGCCLLILVFAKRMIDFVTCTIYIQKLPGPPKHDVILGNVIQLGRDRGEIFKRWQKFNLQYYPIYKMWTGYVSICQILCPEDVELVCSNVKHVSKGIIYTLFSRWLKEGLLTSEGEKWHRRRKVLTPSFHFTILKQFVPIFNEAADCCIDALKNEPSITNIWPFISQFTLKSIADTSMGTKLNFNSEKENSYKNAVDQIAEIFVKRILRPWLFPDCIFMFSSLYRQESKLVNIFHSFTKEIIDARGAEFEERGGQVDPTKRLAMLDLLLTAKHSEGTIDDEGIREEVDTFMFEGHDTTGSAVSFALMLLACHSDIQDLVAKEIKEILGDFAKKPTFRDLQQMKYLERCIKEVLRLYPSVYFISRKLGEDVITKSGYELKKGTLTILHIYGLHHNPSVYPDPERFDPDRFLPENCQRRHPFAYIPFSAGPRNCIGQRFAMLEIKAILCAILGNFILEPVDTPETIEVIADMVLKTKHGIKVEFTERV